MVLYPDAKKLTSPEWLQQHGTLTTAKWQDAAKTYHNVNCNLSAITECSLILFSTVLCKFKKNSSPLSLIMLVKMQLCSEVVPGVSNLVPCPLQVLPPGEWNGMITIPQYHCRYILKVSQWTAATVYNKLAKSQSYEHSQPKTHLVRCHRHTR